MEKMLEAWLGFRILEPPGQARKERETKDSLLLLRPTGPQRQEREQRCVQSLICFTLRISRLQTLASSRKSTVRQGAGHEACASSEWKGTRWFVMKHILVRK